MKAQYFSNAFFSQTLKLLAVWPLGQLVPQVKLLSTYPELHCVQLSTVLPKQYLQLPLQDKHDLLVVYGYMPGLHT